MYKLNYIMSITDTNHDLVDFVSRTIEVDDLVQAISDLRKQKIAGREILQIKARKMYDF